MVAGEHMNILYLTPFNPLDRGLGGAVRSAAILHALRQFANVETIVLAGYETPHKVSADLQIKICERFLAHRRCFKVKFLQLLSILFGLPDFAYFTKGQILNKLGAERDSYDAVVVRYPWLAGQLAAWKIAPCFIDIDDSPKEGYNACNAMKGSVISYIVNRWLSVGWQLSVCKKAICTWISNPMQLDAMRKVCRCEALVNVANGPNDNYKLSPQRGKPFLMTVGWLAYRANFLGIDNFLSLFWPTIKQHFTELEYLIVGRDLPEEYKIKWSKINGVRLMGYVDSLDDLYRDALSIVVPLWIGGGTSVKVIEACKYGCKVMSTAIGARGIDASSLEALNIDIFSTVDELCASVKNWCSKDDVWRCEIRNKIMQYATEWNSEAMFDKAIQDSVNIIGRK